MASSSPNRVAGRRRQRGVRVTVAAGLLGLATAAVVLALPTQSPAWLSVSSVLALVCGAAASRIVYTELLQSRREAAAERAAQAQAYRAMFAERAAEQAEFATVVTDRLASRDRSIRELEATLLRAERRAIDAETRVKRESRRANEAMELVAELQEALSVRRAEEADELASWDAGSESGSALSGRAPDTVADLLTWDQNSGHPAGAPRRRGAADDDLARSRISPSSR